MVRKINDEYFLNRTEAIEYLTHAYHLKWCMTRWENRIIRITLQKVTILVEMQSLKHTSAPKVKLLD